MLAMSEPEVIIRPTMAESVVTKDVNGIKKACERAGLSALQLAEKMNVRETTVFRWRSGKNVPSLAQMHRLCEILECSLDELFPREEATA